MARTSKRQAYRLLRFAAASGAGGVVLAVTLALGVSWPVALTGSWGVAALVTVVAVWIRIWGMDAEQTKANARAEDVARPIADVIILVASIASLGAIGYTLHRAGSAHGSDKVLLIALAITVVSLSWATVHTLYVVRYGDLYYGDPIGGIDFNDGGPPDYHDFAYLALTIGMTFQVSDTDLGSKRMRLTALRHALLSFVFVAVIGALAINSVALLLQ
ncbi:MAG TPA: DUF1345 domain-containing protein [Gaiellaceae bacterium]|jgi:uncharacterized membrane protein|nr:DUF1345 domain-containing protein [Gaiellaceae bacterium]